MCEWLDTETKAILQQVPPRKCAPPDTADTFTLVLLQVSNELIRTTHTLAKVPGVSLEKADLLVSQPCPVPIARGMSIAEAILGQFELICSDCISVFLRDEILSYASQDELRRICSPFWSSHEFASIPVKINLIPQTPDGKRFADQFLGGMAHVACCPHRGYFFEGEAMCKKARIMAHWAAQIGAHAWLSPIRPRTSH